MGPIGYLETSVGYYPSTVRKYENSAYLIYTAEEAWKYATVVYLLIHLLT
jgi:hypothetical protein